MTGEYRAYKITDAAGVLKFRAVVQDGAGACKKPAAVNDGKFLGITQEDQATQNRSVLLKESGRSFAVACEVIAAGDYVRIGDNTGKVGSAQADVVLAPGVAKINYVIGVARTAAGADGDIIEIEIQPCVVKTAVS